MTQRATFTQPLQAATPTAPLRCQWCSTTLAAGVTICPTCGSPGIPDPRMMVPGVDIAPSAAQASAPVEAVELVEWWHDGEDELDDEVRRERTLIDEQEVERRRVETLIVLAGAALACVFIGWLLAPSLLSEPMENFTGTPVEDPGSLRGLGAFFGLLVGLLVGATSGWVIWSGK